MRQFLYLVVPVFLACIAQPSSGIAQPLEAAKATPVEVEKSTDRLRSQLVSFAPYVSMYNNRLTLGQSRVEDVLDELNRLKEYKDNPFDESESLRRSSRDIFGFLVLSQGRITPALKDKRVRLNTDDYPVPPGYFFALSLLESYAEMLKVTDLAKWQAEYDGKCRTAYRSLLPDLRRVAKGEKSAGQPVTVIGSFDKTDWIYLAAVNNTQRTLTNVTLVVRLASIDGETDGSEHYYFIETWPMDKRKYPLRLASDWLPGYGAKATTMATVELISDEMVASGIDCKIDDHVPIAADLFLNEIEKQIQKKSKLKVAIDRLNAMTTPVSRFADRASKRMQLETKAKDTLAGILAGIDAELKKTEEQLSDARKGLAKRNSGFDSVYTAQVADAKKKLEKLKAERIEWVKGIR